MGEAACRCCRRVRRACAGRSDLKGVTSLKPNSTSKSTVVTLRDPGPDVEEAWLLMYQRMAPRGRVAESRCRAARLRGHMPSTAGRASTRQARTSVTIRFESLSGTSRPRHPGVRTWSGRGRRRQPQIEPGLTGGGVGTASLMRRRVYRGPKRRDRYTLDCHPPDHGRDAHDPSGCRRDQ
jgi:hypothetical protein